MKTLRTTIAKLMMVTMTLTAAGAVAHGQNGNEYKETNLKNDNGYRTETVLRIQTDRRQGNMLLCDNTNTSNTTPMQTQPMVLRKDPTTAFLFSLLVPGGGQFYNGESKKGLIQLGMAVTGIVLVYNNWPEYEWVRDDYYWASYGYTREYGNETLMYTGFALYLGGAVWSLIDAPRSANRINRQNGLASDKTDAVPTFSINDLHIDGKLTPGVSCTWNF